MFTSIRRWTITDMENTRETLFQLVHMVSRSGNGNAVMDENELVSGERWTVVEGIRHARMVRWAWMDIGGGGPVMPAEAGTPIPRWLRANLYAVPNLYVPVESSDAEAS